MFQKESPTSLLIIVRGRDGLTMGVRIECSKIAEGDPKSFSSWKTVGEMTPTESKDCYLALIILTNDAHLRIGRGF